MKFLIGGFGLGLCYLPSVVCCGYYFEKRRALATGIAVCGSGQIYFHFLYNQQPYILRTSCFLIFSGVGCFVFAPLTDYLLKELKWDGTILVFAVICLIFCICGSLMRPLELIVKGPDQTEPRRNSTNSIFIKEESGPSFFIQDQQLLEEEEDGVELVIPSFSEPAAVQPAKRSRIMSACEPALTNSNSQFLNSANGQMNSIQSTPQFGMLTRVQSTAGAQLRSKRKESVAYGAQRGSELFLQPSVSHRKESGGGKKS